MIKTALGMGVYGLSEVARYTELHPSRVRSWFTDRSDGKGKGRLFNADYPIINNNYGVSFLDLIDVLIAGQFRNCGVSMRNIRRAYSILSDQLNTEHPFCHSDLYTDGKKIIVLAASSLGDETLSEVLSKQTLFLNIRPYLKHIEYNHETKLAERWRIAKGIVIDPAVSMGKPVVKNTGITTYVLASSYFANNTNDDLVADLFNVSNTDVLNAVTFEEQHGFRSAA